MWCAADNHKYMYHICAKGYFKIRTLIKHLLTKYQIFKELPQISHIHTKIIIFKYNRSFLDQALLPYKFSGKDM